MKSTSLLLSLLFSFLLFSQQNTTNESILSGFEAYAQLPREVVFVHLNKSVYIKGEAVGFKAYVLDKDTKKRSLETKNLYCAILDEDENIVKQQMIRIQEGVGNGIIELDSLFTSGNYLFKAYTNWMRNFSEPNYYQQSLTIIDPEITAEIKPKNTDLVVDAQFLPESGHALVGINATYGVVIKDDRGFGFPFLEGEVVDDTDKTVARFKLNSFGIGRFGIVPKATTRYFARFSLNNQEFKEPIPLIENQGITATLQDLRANIGLILNAKFNNPDQREKPFMLTVHNGDSIKALDISFREDQQVIKVFPKDDLYSGINVFTLFDAGGAPVLERLYFNYQGLHFHEIISEKAQKEKDSIKVSFSVKDLDPIYWNNLSVSILPDETETYKAHHNLPSYILLNPYIKGAVENATYYFTNITPRKQYELDNLLLTQGWSSYQWNTILNNPPGYLYDFEKGITYIVTLNDKQDNQFFIYPTANNESEYVTVADNQTIFSRDDFYPIDKEQLQISEIRKTGDFVQPKIFVRFKPTFIPPFTLDMQEVLNNRTNQILNVSEMPTIGFEGFNKLQMLDEVIVLEERTADRIEKIRNKSVGNVDFFDENDWRRNLFLSTYLSERGYLVDESTGSFTIQARNPNSLNNATPLIYLDGVLLTNFSVLNRFSLDIVDYIEVNKSGIGGGIRGGGGIIKIVTNPLLRGKSQTRNSLIGYKIPLTFSAEKRFYTPMYNSYNGRFFNTYGAVDWHPEVVIDTDGNGIFSFYDHGLPKVKLFIEGIVNDNEFVSDIKELSIE